MFLVREKSFGPELGWRRCMAGEEQVLESCGRRLECIDFEAGVSGTIEI